MTSQILLPNSANFGAIASSARPRFPVKDGRVVGPGVLNVNGIEVNSVLPYDSWRSMDMAVTQVAQPMLAATNSLRANSGLVDPVVNFGTMVARYTMASSVDSATVNMTGKDTPKLDRTERKFGGAPIPMWFAGFEIGARELAAGQLSGEPLDSTEAEAASVDVADLLETTFVDGSSLAFDGYTLYGMRNHTNRITAAASTYSGGTGYWTDPDEVMPTFAGIYAALCAKNQYGPYNVYLATQEWLNLATAYATGSDETLLERVNRLAWINEIVHTPKMTAGQACFLQMSRQTIVLKEHSWIGLSEYVAPVTGTHNFLVKAVLGWMFKPDYDGNLGLLHVTGLHA